LQINNCYISEGETDDDESNVLCACAEIAELEIMRFFNHCDGIRSSVNPNFLVGKEMENFDIRNKDQFCEVRMFI